MSARRIRVLVVDDSAFARKVVREILEAAPSIEVVGIARDGLEALEKIAELSPDVLTLDLMMPNLDGLGVLRALPAVNPPRVVVVSMTDDDSRLGLLALEAGAIDIVHKPTALAVQRLYNMSEDLVAKVTAAAAARAPHVDERPSIPSLHRAPKPAHSIGTANGVVVIGASTGGPQALTRLLTALPADFPAPVAVVLHIPAGYTEAFAARLNTLSELEVIEGYEGAVLSVGRIIIARAGHHFTFRRSGDDCVVHQDLAPLDSIHRPSVDVMFHSAAEVYGERTLGVVLTGMGQDGLDGARAIHAAGGTLVNEAESSCVVYGMPRAIRAAGLSAAEVPIDQMVDEIVRRMPLSK